MSGTNHESDVRVLSDFVRGQRNLVGDHWAPSMAREALDRVLAELATEAAAREAGERRARGAEYGAESQRIRDDRLALARALAGAGLVQVR